MDNFERMFKINVYLQHYNVIVFYNLLCIIQQQPELL